MKVCVHGNIGVGKTTLIESQYKDFERMIEPIEQWQIKIDNKIINKPLPLSEYDQDIIVFFQIMVMVSRLQQYKKIEPNKNYIFERSIQEDIEIFCKLLMQKLDTQHKSVLTVICMKCAQREPYFDKNIILKEQTNILIERIKQRNRQHEIIDQQYLQQLQEQYYIFNQQRLYKCSLQDHRIIPNILNDFLNSLINTFGFGQKRQNVLLEHQKWLVDQLKSVL